MRLKLKSHSLLAVAAIAATVTASAAPPSRSPRTQWTDGVLWNSGDYRYDAAGHIIRIGEDRYVYDGANRIVSATAMTPGNAKNKQVFDYDRYGNLQVLTTETNNDGAFGIEFAVTPSSNRLDGDCVRGLPCVLAAYDGAGNQTGMIAGDGRYTWDAAGMMTELNLPGRNERYVYDANDERVVLRSMSGGETRRYTLRGSDNKLAREVTRTGDTWAWSRDYVYRGGLLLASFVSGENGDGPHRHYHLDHLGTPRVVTDGRRYKIALSTYWAFGQEAPGSVSAPGERLKFTGHERDSNPSGPGWDLDYMHARYYSPGWGRFLSMDPEWASADASAAQSWNRYAYVKNNPIGYTDPDGRKDKPFNAATDRPVTPVPGTETPINPFIRLGGSDPVAFNCHAFAWHGGEGDAPGTPGNSERLPRWDNSANDDLGNAEQLAPDAPNEIGDRVLYFVDSDGSGTLDPNTEPAIHSAVVTGVDQDGNTTEVTAKMGQAEMSTNHPDAPGYYKEDSNNQCTTRAYFRAIPK